MKAYYTVGCPGSGKSYRALQMCKDDPNLIRVNRDEFRIQILQEQGKKIYWKNALDKKIESEVQNRQNAAIKVAARIGRSVVVDSCHLSGWAQKKIVRFLTDLGYTTEMLDFRDTPLEVCLERNRKRTTGLGPVNENVIRKMYKDHIEDKKMTPLPEFVPNSLPTCIIVDIDGTLADKGDRHSFDETCVFNDTVREHIRMTVLGLWNQVNHCFIFSGRSNNCRHDTLRWLNEKCHFEHLASDWSLHMRNSKDFRRDSIVKLELFEEFVKDKFNVVCAIDDRGQIIEEVWKHLGIPCLNVGVFGEQDF